MSVTLNDIAQLAVIKLINNSIPAPRLNTYTVDATPKNAGDIVTATKPDGATVDVTLGKIADVSFRVSGEDLALTPQEFNQQFGVPAFQALSDRIRTDAAGVAHAVLVTSPQEASDSYAVGSYSAEGITAQAKLDGDVLSVSVLYGFASAA